MKSGYLLLFATVVTITALVSGCSRGNQPTRVSTSITATSEILPSEAIPISTSTLTLSLVPSLTLTPIFALSASDAHAYVSQFLNDNSDCRLPCWLGITPGKSTVLDVSEQLQMFSGITTASSHGIPGDRWLVSSFTLPYLSEDNKVIEIFTAYLNFTGETEITVVGFEMRAYGVEAGNYTGDIYGYPSYNESFKLYTISGVFSRYGRPDRINVTAALRGDTLVTPGYGDYFELHVWYPAQGIFMKYKMAVERSGDNYRICPSNAFIYGDLMPSGLGTRYQDILLQLGDQYRIFFPPSTDVKTPEDAFGITDEEFYQLFRFPADRCLETPISFWWPWWEK